MTQPTPEPGAGQALAAALAGKFMTFRLAKEEYALPILKVRELVGLLEVTRVPGAPAAVRGVVNLRGKVVPVLDLRARFGLSAEGAAARPVIIVAQVAAPTGTLTMGVLVDEVLEVRSIREAEIEPPPPMGNRTEIDFILGIGKTEKSVIFLLDIDRVLTGAEVTRIAADLNPAEAA